MTEKGTTNTIAPRNVIAIKPVSTAYATFIFMYSLMVDVILYATIFPLFGTYLSGACAKTFELSPKFELLLTVILTFIMVFGTFCLFGEAGYWKHLFAFESLFSNILKIRDVVNSIIFIACIVFLASTIEAMVGDKAMKPQHVSEGTGYFFIKTFFGWLHLDEALGLQLPHTGSIMDPDFGENGRFEHGAAYMFYWAVLSSCVAKLVYFNTLFTYLRAMDIFLSLNPVFEDDDDGADSTDGTCAGALQTPN